MRVLLVVEDPRERMRASTALSLHAGAEVTETDSPKAARRLLREGATFDVLVVDGDLQPQGGFSFLYELRATAELTGEDSPPALVMIAREQDRFLTDWSGANDLIMKPVDPFEVVRRVRAMLGDEPAPLDLQDESGEQVPGNPGAPRTADSVDVPRAAGGVQGASGTP